MRIVSSALDNRGPLSHGDQHRRNSNPANVFFGLDAGQFNALTTELAHECFHSLSHAEFGTAHET
jgi:hypothetical protein